MLKTLENKIETLAIISLFESHTHTHKTQQKTIRKERESSSSS